MHYKTVCELKTGSISNTVIDLSGSRLAYFSTVCIIFCESVLIEYSCKYFWRFFVRILLFFVLPLFLHPFFWVHISGIFLCCTCQAYYSLNLRFSRGLEWWFMSCLHDSVSCLWSLMIGICNSVYHLSHQHLPVFGCRYQYVDSYNSFVCCRNI